MKKRMRLNSKGKGKNNRRKKDEARNRNGNRSKNKENRKKNRSKNNKNGSKNDKNWRNNGSNNKKNGRERIVNTVVKRRGISTATANVLHTTDVTTRNIEVSTILSKQIEYKLNYKPTQTFLMTTDQTIDNDHSFSQPTTTFTDTNQPSIQCTMTENKPIACNFTNKPDFTKGFTIDIPKTKKKKKNIL